ncbi:MAG: SRPBCC family protein [Pseudobdellovibrio sp.]
MQSQFIYISYIKATPEQLWKGLTSPEMIRKWWGGGLLAKSDWKTGSSWSLCHENGILADSGEIIEAKPPEKLILKWRNESNTEMTAEGYSLCTFELNPVDEAVKLAITHQMDVANSKFIAAVSNGWPMIISNLKSLLETGDIVLKEKTENYGR